MTYIMLKLKLYYIYKYVYIYVYIVICIVYLHIYTKTIYNFTSDLFIPITSIGGPMNLWWVPIPCTPAPEITPLPRECTRAVYLDPMGLDHMLPV